MDSDFPEIASPIENLDELLELNDGLDRLAEIDASKAELVKLLYFAGLNLDEAAAAQGISPAPPTAIGFSPAPGSTTRLAANPAAYNAKNCLERSQADFALSWTERV